LRKNKRIRKLVKQELLKKEVDCESFFGFFKTVEAHAHKDEGKDDDSCCDAPDEMMDHVDFGTTL